ncbi:hypothetical protein DdX_18666 [Ditylenchus destructor]|uniref:Uncharacterized protein n=1 Tax=Ditylenchus destructor TaxID=166010 RepID=A0AAD4QY28_9BILA|nr:hypothetical protein DdX_18666 [Ditylenchus destructor]
MHSIKELCFESASRKVLEEEKLLYDSEKEIPAYDKSICIGASDTNRVPAAYIVKKMGLPGPFIRFSKVTMRRCQDEPMLDFLLRSNESFLGCKFSVFCYNYKDRINVQNQVKYLLDNVFHSPSWVSFVQDTSWIGVLSPILQTKGVAYCDRLDVQVWQLTLCDCATNRELIHWLENRPLQGRIRHLVLKDYPKELIEDLVRNVREEFEKENSNPSEFLISFSGCRGSCRIWNDDDPIFSAENPGTKERLSFFKNTSFEQLTPCGCRIYRLWRRQVVNETDDSRMLSYLKNSQECEIDADIDHKFYSIYDVL